MEMVIEVLITLLIKYENGFKANGEVKHKVNRIPFMREDITREEILAAVDVMRPVMVGKIVSVKLETKKIKRVWTPEMRREKLEREAEEFETSSAQRAAVSAPSAAASVNTASGTTTATVGVQSTAAPVSAPLFPARDFFIDDSYRKKETEVKKMERMEKMPYDMSHVDWSGTPTARLMRQFDARRAQKPPANAEKTKAAQKEETAMQTQNISSGIPYRGNFMERMRANGFKVTPEEFMPAKATAHIGVAPKLEKIDAPPIYRDGP